jgi:uncharacterized protein (TIGR02466 family)
MAILPMTVEARFSSPLCSRILHIDNQKIEDYCFKLQAESTAGPRPGGWQSGMLDFNTSELKPLVAHVKSMLTEVSQLYFIKSPYKLILDNAWVNINNPGLDQLPNNYYHFHPEYFFSFVYYVKAEKNAGNISLVNPSQLLEFALPEMASSEYGMFNASRIQVAPEPKKLIAFPAWIQHFVNPNASETERISIAFNAKLTKY